MRSTASFLGLVLAGLCLTATAQDNTTSTLSPLDSENTIVTLGLDAALTTDVPATIITEIPEPVITSEQKSVVDYRYEPDVDDIISSQSLAMQTKKLMSEIDELTSGSLRHGYGITVQQAINIALQNNISLKIQYQTPVTRQWGIEGSWGEFDPTFTASISAAHNRSTDIITGISTHNFSNTASVGLSGSLPTGTDYSLGASMERSGVQEESPWFDSTTNFSITQSLLKGAGTDVNMVTIRTAENTYCASLYQLQNNLISLVTNVQNAYWNLYIAMRALDIQRTTYNLALQTTQKTIELVRVERSTALDLASARAELSQNVTDVIAAAAAVKTAEINLMELLNPSHYPEGWNSHFYPIDAPVLKGETIDLEERVKLAMRLRPDLKQAMIDFDNSELQIISTQNGLLPRLDYFISLRLGGSNNSFVSATRSNLEPDEFGWNTGLQLSMPLQNRSAIASYKQSEISRQVALDSIENMRQTIQADVRTAAIAIESAARRVETTRITRELREQEYAAEVEKYNVKRSIQLLVNQAQRDLRDAALSEAKAQISLIEAYLALYQAEGSTLQRAGIKPAAPMNIYRQKN